jgi:shikimate kinase
MRKERSLIITLIGFRGTGKSTLGRLLASRLGWASVDTDDEIQRLTGKSISELFHAEGEAAFRRYESQVIQHLARRHKVVVAAGGGAVLDPENRRLLSVAGPIVWLTATPETLLRRLQHDPLTAAQRPPLTGHAPAEEIVRVLTERSPIYQSCADVTIDTDDREPRELVEPILAALDLAPEAGLS